MERRMGAYLASVSGFRYRGQMSGPDQDLVIIEGVERSMPRRPWITLESASSGGAVFGTLVKVTKFEHGLSTLNDWTLGLAREEAGCVPVTLPTSKSSSKPPIEARARVIKSKCEVEVESNATFLENSSRRVSELPTRPGAWHRKRRDDFGIQSSFTGGLWTMPGSDLPLRKSNIAGHSNKRWIKGVVVQEWVKERKTAKHEVAFVSVNLNEEKAGSVGGRLAVKMGTRERRNLGRNAGAAMGDIMSRGRLHSLDTSSDWDMAFVGIRRWPGQLDQDGYGPYDGGRIR
ncbi:hypothetical protein BDN72DRAFT_865150 [Pluteus cervinus]|uniref:Uncharacterized protein n=1 Tax=Pluteus cervinus TaxID=181527 RepID=A0ACD3A159_9AGAR|nr:hypothetical protein BDN72DRAFT_865150 [Pluteus cervinus]